MKKAYLAIKYHPNHRNRELVEEISAVLAESGWQTVCIARDVERWGQERFSPSALMQRTFTEIEACRLVIIELSEKGVGLGIEAGYARAKGMPIVTIARKEADISATLRGISQEVFHYDRIDELRTFFSQITVSLTNHRP